MQAVREARVVRLHEVEVDDGIERGQDEPRQHLAAEVGDVRVDERHVVGAFLGEQQAHRQPAGPALARAADVETGLFHLLQEPRNGGGAVPEDHLAVGIGLEVLERPLVVLEGRLVERDDEGVEIRRLAQLGHDPREGRTIHLGGDHRDHERHGELGCEGADQRLELLDRLRQQARQGRDGSELLEVAHGSSGSRGTSARLGAILVQDREQDQHECEQAEEVEPRVRLVHLLEQRQESTVGRQHPKAIEKIANRRSCVSFQNFRKKSGRREVGEADRAGDEGRHA